MTIKVRVDRNGFVGFLCHRFYCTKYRYSWSDFWMDINTRNKYSAAEYFKHYPSDFEIGLVRLMLVEDFRQYLKERKK